VCSGKSFMKVKNSNGPITVPCGTSDITSAQEDVTPSNTTLSVSCKILGHVIHSQIMDHFDRWNILTDKQHGFRSRRSCESQLIITIDALAKSLAKGEQVEESNIRYSVFWQVIYEG
jgi:hypothetical protein